MLILVKYYSILYISYYKKCAKPFKNKKKNAEKIKFSAFSYKINNFH